MNFPGCSKRPSSSFVIREASFVSRCHTTAVSWEIRFTIHASRLLSEKLADFFSSLLGRKSVEGKGETLGCTAGLHEFVQVNGKGTIAASFQ